MKPIAALAAAVAAVVLSGCVKPTPAPAPGAARAAAPFSAARAGETPADAAGSAASIVVTEGDTLYALARRNGAPLEALIAANGLAPPYVIYPGQRLRVPDGAPPRRAAAQRARAAAAASAVSVAQLPAPAPQARPRPAVPPLEDANRRDAGAESESAQPAAPEPRRTAERAAQRAAERAVAAAGGESRPAARSAAPAPAAPAKVIPVAAVRRPARKPESAPPAPSGGSRPAFLWPVEGPILARFGPRGAGRNDGINIGAPAGAPVRAAENGVVVYAGNELRGYGNLLLVRHAGGWTSAYAHNSELLVDRGATVTRGQTIARVGRTGGVGEPQSHFELRKGPDAVDPLEHLAAR